MLIQTSLTFLYCIFFACIFLVLLLIQWREEKHDIMSADILFYVISIFRVSLGGPRCLERDCHASHLYKAKNIKMSFPKPDENLHLTDSVADYRSVALGTGSDVCLPSAP